METLFFVLEPRMCLKQPKWPAASFERISGIKYFCNLSCRNTHEELMNFSYLQLLRDFADNVSKTFHDHSELFEFVLVPEKVKLNVKQRINELLRICSSLSLFLNVNLKSEALPQNGRHTCTDFLEAGLQELVVS